MNRNPSPGTRFEPGRSGNPGGLPNYVREVRKLAGTYSPKALKRLVKLVDSKDERVALGACEAILDRAGVRAFAYEPEKIAVELNETGDPIGRLSVELARRLTAIGARRGSSDTAAPGS